MNVLAYSKAIVPVVVMVVLLVLGHFGVRGDTTVQDALTGLLTAGLVYLVPNQK